MVMIYNNFGNDRITMKQTNIIQKNGLNSGNFFYHRIIREFEDKDEPMLWKVN